MDAFEASITIAAMDGGPSVEFYMHVDAGQKFIDTAQPVKGGELTSRDEIPSAADLPPHVEEDPVFLLGPGGLGDTRVEFLPETLCGLIVRSSRKIFGNFMPTVTMLANGFQEQLVLLECPSPLPERGIEGVDPALATGFIRSPVDKFGDLYPVNLFTGCCSVCLCEGC